MGLGIKIPKNAFKVGRKNFAEGNDYGNVEPDPGKHISIFQKGRAVDTQNGPQIVMDFKLAGESEQAGGKVSVWFSLAEDRIHHLFKALDALGYEVDELDEDQLEEVLGDLEKNKPVVRLTVKQKGEYTNIYIDKLMEDLTAADVGGEDEDSDGDEDEDKPKKKKGSKKDADEDEDESGDEDEDEEKPAKKKGKKDEDEDEDEDGDSEEEDEDEDEDEEKPAKKKAGKKAKKEDEDEDADDEDADEDSDDEDEKPAKKKGSKKKDEDEDDAEEDPSGDEDEVELEVGMKVKSADGKWKGTAKVVGIDEDKGILKVKTKDGAVHKVKPDAVKLPE